MNPISLSQLVMPQIPSSQFLMPEYETHMEDFLQKEGVKSDSPLFDLLKFNEDFPSQIQRLYSLLIPHQSRNVTVGELLDSLEVIEVPGAKEFINSYKNLDRGLKASSNQIVHVCLLLGFVRLTTTRIEELDDKTVSDPTNLLYVTAMTGVFEIWKALVNKGGILPFSKSSQGQMLFFTALHGDFSFLKFLLRKGVDPNFKKDETYQTALHIAAEKGHLHIVECLLDAGVNPNTRDSKYKTPLYLALKNGYSPIVDLLYNRGARLSLLHDIIYLQTNGWSYQNESEDFLSIHADSENCSPIIPGDYDLIHIAASEGDLKVVEGLVSRGVLIDQRDLSGKTPLSIAVAYGYFSIVRFLLKNGADAHYISPDGRSVLEGAVQGMNLSIVRHNLQQGSEY